MTTTAETTSTDELAIVESFCQEVVRRRLTIPVLVALELTLPIDRWNAYILRVMAPFLSFLTTQAHPDISAKQLGSVDTPHQVLSRFLQRSDSISMLADRIEALELERSTESTTHRERPLDRDRES